MNPIEKAVAPLRKDAIERAHKEALTEIEAIREGLAKHGGDINKAAPYPSTYGPEALHGLRYHAARAKYTRYHSITSDDESVGYQTRRPNSPHFVVIDDAKAAEYIKQRKRWAGEEYDAFVQKLVAKIGPVTSAKLHGNHVWDFSTLIVTKPGNLTEAWKTQQIMNYSKLGKPFNQWPTRQLKKVPAL